MINEMIKRSANEGLEKVRIPTWQTLAKIEMFDSSDEASAMPAFQERLENYRQANNMDQYPDEQKPVLRNHKKTTDEYQKKYRKGEEVQDEDGNSWIEFDVTEEDAKAPVVAFQKEGGEAKGAVKFDKNGAATVYVFDGADLSTLAHEMVGHVGRRLFERLAKKSPSFARDYESAKKWAGVKEDGVWTTEAEEKFARGFERYLRDKKGPNDSTA